MQLLSSRGTNQPTIHTLLGHSSTTQNLNKLLPRSRTRNTIQNSFYGASANIPPGTLRSAGWLFWMTPSDIPASAVYLNINTPWRWWCNVVVDGHDRGITMRRGPVQCPSNTQRGFVLIFLLQPPLPSSPSTFYLCKFSSICTSIRCRLVS